jgi:LAGLIDADG endonuclease
MNSYRKFIGDGYYSPNHVIIGNLNYIPLSVHYVNGFIAGDGCLSLTLIDKNFCKMSLQISQHINNRALLEDIASYFKSPSKVYRHDKNSLQITLNYEKNVIFKHFTLYPLSGSKVDKLTLVRKLIFNKKHLM